MFIVEDGSGVANANSYLSVAGADAYFSDFGNPTAWVDAKAATSLTLGAQPINDETFTIGSTVYIYKTTPTPADKEIPIGAALLDTQINTRDVINGDVTRNANIPAGTTAHPDVEVTALVGNVLTITAKVGGSAGNAIILTETFLNPLNIFSTDNLEGGAASKEQALIFATQYLDSVYVPRYLGTIFSDEQRLYWPRAGVDLNNGRLLATNELPRELLDATAELALKAVDGSDIFSSDSDDNGVVSERAVKVGPLSERLKFIGGSEPIKKYRKVNDILWNILRPAGEVRRA